MSNAWVAHNEFTGDNLTAIDEAWKGVDIDYGLVTLSKTEIESLDLPPSLKFPWDPEGHSIYILTALHSMHCLVRGSFASHVCLYCLRPVLIIVS